MCEPLILEVPAQPDSRKMAPTKFADDMVSALENVAYADEVVTTWKSEKFIFVLHSKTWNTPQDFNDHTA